MTAKAFLMVVVLVLLSQSTSAQVIYKYVNFEGGISYGDVLPEGAVLIEEIELVYVPKENAEEASDKLIEKMAKTADRLKADRESREAARKPPVPDRPAPTPAPAPVIVEHKHYYPYYPYGRRYSLRHRPHRPYPDIYKPPYRLDNSGRERSGPVLVSRSKLLIP